MRLAHVALTASLIMASLIGCASSHTKPRHAYAYPKHGHAHTTGHAYRRPHYPAHGHHHGERHGYPHVYRPPPPVPGRTPDGRYVLPGGLESVCAGGTPPPCQ